MAARPGQLASVMNATRNGYHFRATLRVQALTLNTRYSTLNRVPMFLPSFTRYYAHPVSRSVPSAREYASTPTRMIAISTNDREAAAG